MYLPDVGDSHPKVSSLRRRELDEERCRVTRDNPPENYRAALEAWGFRWEWRGAGWRHRTGARMSPEEAARIGQGVLRDQDWTPGEAAFMWAQPDLRMAFLPEDLGALFPGPTGPYDLWHWVGHRAGINLGVPRCGECGQSLGPPAACEACGREKRGGRCPVCSMVLVARG